MPSVSHLWCRLRCRHLSLSCCALRTPGWPGQPQAPRPVPAELEGDRACRVITAGDGLS
jgi:hypothetical protein